MLRSMTAFGRGKSLGEMEDFVVEIHSVNSRRLEIVINCPGHLTQFDPPLRKLIGRDISRGRVSVHVSCQPAYGRAQVLRPNTELARQIKNAYDELKKELGYHGDVDFATISSHPDLLVPANSSADPERRWSALQAAAGDALTQLIAMKEAEGENLRAVFEDCLAGLARMVACLEEIAPASVQKHTDKLREKIQQAALELPDNEERLLREIVIFTDKLDVCEEVARLKSHLEQFRSLMDEPGPCGRSMDFLVQEMNREINTIGAKADDLRVSQMVVKAKAELEKMREQAQNIE